MDELAEVLSTAATRDAKKRLFIVPPIVRKKLSHFRDVIGASATL